MEAVISTEIGMPTLRTKVLGMANAEAIFKDLDMVDRSSRYTSRILPINDVKLIKQTYKVACIPS